MQDVTSTIYITNFPTSVGSKDLWNHCNKHGTVADVYIARKLSKVGRRFAFVRFLKIKNNESLINDLNKIWIGSYHLFAALARFDKKPTTTTKTNPKSSSNIINEPVKKTSFTAHTNPKHSYVNVLNGNGPTNLASHPKNILKSVTLDESDLIDTSGIRNVLLAKVRDVNLIPNINIVLNKEGFYNFQCKYIGGMWLWIEFDTYEACLKLQSNKEMSWYFTLLKHLHHSFVLDERVAWIEIGGLPLNAWTPKAFKKIADSWGTPLFVDDDPKETVSTGRVCIKTKIHGQVNDYCKVVVLGKSYNVYVKEFAGWAPDIKATDSISCSNSEMGNSDKHEDNLNDNDLLDKEEASSHSPKDKSRHQKEDSNSISKPPGFEAYNSNGKRFSSDGNHQSSKQPSHFSSAPVKSSRISKSQNKSFCNHGSMIEAFVSHIEMGKWNLLRNGRSGGIVSIWDPNAFSKINEFHYENFLVVEGPHLIIGDFTVLERLRKLGYSIQIMPQPTFLINSFEDASTWDTPLGGPFVSALSVDSQRSSWIDSLRAIELKENMDFSQKAKIKWGIKADENSKFFHAIVNQKRRYLSIQGIKIEGHWIEDPLGIKDAFLTFYEQKFQKVEVVKIVNRSPFYKTLNIDQNTYLASSVSEAEIRDAIWDCGSDKSPGPDGFTFAFYKDFWNVIKSDVMDFVHHFFNNGILPRGCNTSFITLIPKVPSPMVISDFRPISLIGAQYKIIAKVLANRLARVIDSVISHEQSAFIKQRQILDGPLMVNEVIQWCKRKKSKLMVFKIDFEKAFDTISWDFLLQVMHFMGFSESWIKWILGCLHSASSSILINGSPTREFNIHRGLRQGDPLSPFLFIIAMEGLHVAMEDAVTAGLYKGFKINTLNLSHLFFADDALFIGDWSRNNIKSLVSILECFHQVSGLKINYHKSKLFGIGVPFDEVALLASCTGCNALESPFSYLGLPIDCNMALVKSWDPISDKFAKCLSKWKASLLSIGGRATLISSGSDDNSKKIPWISWNLALASKEKRGLGIGSLYALNHALIQKWRWRFLNNPHALWTRLIVAIHGPNEDSSSFFSHIKGKGVWNRIVGSINSMHEKGFIPHSSILRRVNNGTSTRFWHDTWTGTSSLKHQYPRLFRLALNKDCLVRDCWNNGWHFEWSRNISNGTNANLLASLHCNLSDISLNDSEDTWVWSSGNSLFLDRLPSRWNLSRRGIEVASITCPICDNGIDTSYHSLWVCSLATTVWIRVFNWLDLHPPSIPNLRGLYTWLDDLHMSSNKKAILVAFYLIRLLNFLLDGIPLETNCLPFHGTIRFKTL
ncbi:RNA-directed DNA polymerase, eukaryota [Tanacetum coccineum]